MARLPPLFSANRTFREYTERHYLPAAAAYRARAADKTAVGKQVVGWKDALEQQWSMLHFGDVKVETVEQEHVFEVQVYLGDVLRIRCESSFMPTESTARARFGRR